MREARDLLSYTLGVTDSFLLAHAENPVRNEAAVKYKSLIGKRLQGTPFAYLTKRRGFFGLDFFVDSTY